MGKQIHHADRHAIIAMANRNYASNGRANSDGLANAFGVSTSFITGVLRRADNQGLLTRSCSAALGSLRCGAPIPERDRGNLKVTTCHLHRQAPQYTHAEDAMTRAPRAAATSPVAPPAMPEELATALDGLTVEMVEGEPRASALQLAELLGYKRPLDIKDLIARNQPVLEKVGGISTIRTVRSVERSGRGTVEMATDVPWLNRTQCTIVAMKASTPNAEEAQVKIAQAFEREQDRTAAALNNPAPAPAIGGASIDVAALVAASDARMERMFDRLPQMMAAIIGAVVAGREPVAQPAIAERAQAFDIEASATDKGNFLSVSDIAGVNQLPGGPALKRRNWALVTLWLKTSGIFRNPKHCRIHKIQMLLGGKTKEADSWVYDPAVVGASTVLREVASYLFQALRDGNDVPDAYAHAREFIKNSTIKAVK